MIKRRLYHAMYIALIADDHKKELMAEFCIAYAPILAKHHLCATNTTGQYVSDAAGLDIETFLPGSTGGMEQITSRVSYNEIDVVFYFRSTDHPLEPDEAELDLLRQCDVYNIPLATNIATAEVLVTALEAGTFDWREYVNPISDYSLNKKKK